jgi:hypothetical protein
MINAKMYKFKKPNNIIEKMERFILIEDRGERVLVESSFSESCGTITPTFVLSKNELEEVK